MKPMLKRIPIVLSVVASSAAFASSFPDIDLRLPGFSMEKIPVLDQSDYGLCYAYAASAMVDAYRLSHPEEQPAAGRDPGHLTSPIAAAVRQSSEKSAINLFFTDPVKKGGGFVCSSVRSIQKHGSCDSRLLADQSHFDLRELQDIYGRINALDDQLASLENDRIMGAANDRLIDQVAADKKSLVTGTSQFLALLGSTEKLTPGEIDQASRSRNSMGFLSKTALKACEAPGATVPVKMPSCLTTNAPTRSIAIDMINEALDKPNPQPVGIEYCANVLLDGRKYHGNFFKAAWSLVDEKSCYGHASLVIGRRNVADAKEDSRLQFLVRNSWGGDCSSYSNDWECDERGDIWVDATSLADSIMGLAFTE